MTDKDPNDMTASEQLRLADSHPCSMCHLVMDGDESCATTGCASWAYRLADKIDAELAQARGEALRQGADLWAKANGWPDFREGEDFGAWLDRCTYKKPVDDCNEPVQFGDEIELHYLIGGADKGRFQEVTVNRGPVWMLSFTGVDHERLYRYDSECDILKRPAPEALGADGKPIVAGETVWGILSGIEGIVNSPNDDSTAYVEWDDGRWSPCIDCCNLTHTPPDTQQKIDEDAEKFHCVYFGGYGACGTCPASTGELSKKSCKQQQIFDLLRRQRELDARTGGAE